MIHTRRRMVIALASVVACGGLVAMTPRPASLKAEQPVAPADPTAMRPAATATATSALPRDEAVFVDPYAPDNRYGALALADTLSAIVPAGAESAVAPADTAAAPAPAPAARAWVIPGRGPLMRGELVAQTARVDVYVGKGTFDPDLVAEVAPALERMLLQDEQGFWPTRLERRISIGFYSLGSAPSKGVRGMAYTADGRIEVYFRPNEDIRNAVTIAAHEFAHHIQYERYGRDVQSRADTILHEGGATWISGVRWLSEYDEQSWRSRAKHLNDAGIPLVLTTAERYGADNAYEIWASFVSYIVKFYGADKYDALYISSRGRSPGSADYQGVLGVSFKDLQAEWQDYVRSYVAPTPTPEPTPEPTPAPTSH